MEIPHSRTSGAYGRSHAPTALILVPSHSNHSGCDDVCPETMPKSPEAKRNPNTRSDLDAALIAPQEVPLTTPIPVADPCGWDLVPKNY